MRTLYMRVCMNLSMPPLWRRYLCEGLVFDSHLFFSVWTCDFSSWKYCPNKFPVCWAKSPIIAQPKFPTLALDKGYSTNLFCPLHLSAFFSPFSLLVRGLDVVLWGCAYFKLVDLWSWRMKYWDLKGIVHQFWIDNIFSCPNERNSFYKMFISIEQLWLEIIEKNGAQSQSVLYIWYV